MFKEFFFILVLAGSRSSMARDFGPADTSLNITAEKSSSQQILDRLDEAQRFYYEAQEQFRQGNYDSSRGKIDKAFGLISSIIAEQSLVTEVQPQWESLVDKIQETQAPDLPISSSTFLDVPKQDLESTVVSTSALSSQNKYTITIEADNNLVRKFIAYYSRGRRETVLRALERSGLYRGIILAALAKAKLPRELFYLVMTESEYKPAAYSRSGAAGLWQLMPSTARRLGLKVNYWVDERFDPEKSTAAAVKYLKELYDLFEDWHLALAAWNRGENGIGKDMRAAKVTDLSSLSQMLPQETESFVPKFMACVLIGDNPKEYGFEPRYEEAVSYDTVIIEKPLDFKIAAQCAQTTEDVLRRLNPAIRAWCTPLQYPRFELRIPKGSREHFAGALAEVKDWNPSRGVVRHKVRPGEALSKIARKYRTTVKEIVADNRIANPKRLRPGQVLTIRPGRKFLEKDF